MSTCFTCGNVSISNCQPRTFTHERFALFSDQRDQIFSLVTEKGCLRARWLLFVFRHYTATYFIFFKLLRHIMRNLLIPCCRFIVRLASLVHDTTQYLKVTGGRIINGAPPYLISKTDWFLV
jgi:hypothetical protein